jgi:hypothetical protein
MVLLRYRFSRWAGMMTEIMVYSPKKRPRRKTNVSLGRGRISG